MEETRKMNVLVIGSSGAGKSTLIKAISGTDVVTGVGEGNTQNISVYESSTWPLCLIDTKGFEYSKSEQAKTVKQVKQFTKRQIEKSRMDSTVNAGIDAVWYCVEGTSRRTFSYNLDIMNKAIKNWKSIPVFAVITKSYSEADVSENIEAVERTFGKDKNINLRGIIPVIAESYRINEDTIVEPKGIDELCNATLDCSELAKSISEENRNRMVLQQMRFTANMYTAGATAAAIVVGAAPISFADSLLLVPLETSLTKSILKIYKVDFSGDLITAIVGSAAITNIAKAALSALKTIPNIAGSVLNAVVAGFFVAALGEAVIAVAEAMKQGKISKEKIDSVVAFVSDKLKDNAVFGFAIKYLEDNAEKLQGKSAKDVFKLVEKAVKDEANSVKTLIKK